MNRPTKLIQDVATLRALCGDHHLHTCFNNRRQPAGETENAA